MSLVQPNEVEFYTRIEMGLSSYPALRARLPKGYPRAGTAAVDCEKALSFEESRTEHFGHNINLPLALYLAGYADARPGARSFARQLLDVIETFLARFEGTRGVVRVVEPLWLAGWDVHDPAFWTVIAHAVRALRLLREGATIVEFEARTGWGNATADIYFHMEGVDVFLDVELWHAATGTTVQQVRERALTRAERKAMKKFAALPDGARGVVSEYCFPALESFSLVASERKLLKPFPLTSTARSSAEVFVFLGIADKAGQLWGFRIADDKSDALPVLPVELQRR